MSTDAGLKPVSRSDIKLVPLWPMAGVNQVNVQRQAAGCPRTDRLAAEATRDFQHDIRFEQHAGAARLG